MHRKSLYKYILCVSRAYLGSLHPRIFHNLIFRHIRGHGAPRSSLELGSGLTMKFLPNFGKFYNELKNQGSCTHNSLQVKFAWKVEKLHVSQLYGNYFQFQSLYHQLGF